MSDEQYALSYKYTGLQYCFVALPGDRLAVFTAYGAHRTLTTILPASEVGAYLTESFLHRQRMEETMRRKEERDRTAAIPDLSSIDIEL